MRYFSNKFMMKVVLTINPLPAMNFLIQTVLSPKHTIILAPDVVRGMQVLKNRSSIDVIIVDAENDSAEDLEFIYHVRNSRLYSDCILISLRSQMISERDADVIQCIDRIFYKPFSPEQLIDYVNRLPKSRQLNLI